MWANFHENVGIPACKIATIALVAGLLVGTSATGARAQLSETPRENMWITDGPVYSFAQTSGTLYIGGRFDNIGLYTGGGIPTDAATGQRLSAYDRVDGTVHDCLPDGQGGWYVAGRFTEVEGLAYSAVTHILSDGSVDPAWSTSVGAVDIWAKAFTLALSQDRTILYVGGQFSVIGGESRKNIAALVAATGSVTAWNPDSNGPVDSLAVSGSTIYAGGRFSLIGGQARYCLAALDAGTGNATAWDPDPNGSIKTVATSGSTVYAGGVYSGIGGETRSNIAAIDTAGVGTVTAWDPNPDNTIWDIALDGSTVYACGYFTNIGGQTRNYLAALDENTANATAWNPDPDGQILSLFIHGSTIHVGGAFTSIGGLPRQSVAALDTATSAPTAWAPIGPKGWVYTVGASDSTAYFGGAFWTIGEKTRSCAAAVDIRTGQALAWNPDPKDIDGTDQPYSSVNDLALSTDSATVFLGGHFNSVDGQACYHIAAVDATTGSLITWDTDRNSPGFWIRTLDLSEDGSTLYLGGTDIPSAYRPSHLAAIDVTSGVVTGWEPLVGTFEYVYALDATSSTVYIGGNFTSVNGQTRNRIAAVDAATGALKAWNPDADGDVYSILTSGSTVYVGGDFQNIGGQARSRLAALDMTSGTATAWNPGADGRVAVQALSGSTLYVGGEFTTIGGENRDYIAALDAATGAVAGWNPGADGEVTGIGVFEPLVFVGGRFRHIGGKRKSGFAQFGPEITPERLQRLVDYLLGKTQDSEGLDMNLDNRIDIDDVIEMTAGS